MAHFVFGYFKYRILERKKSAVVVTIPQPGFTNWSIRNTTSGMKGGMVCLLEVLKSADVLETNKQTNKQKTNKTKTKVNMPSDD